MLRRAHLRRLGLQRARTALGGRFEIGEVVLQTPNRLVLRGCHDGRPVYVKLRRQPGSLRREAEAHEVVAALDLPATRSLAYAPGRPEVLVTEAVAGRPLAERTDVAAWADTGAALRRFHDPAGGARVRPFEGDADWVAGCERRISTRARAAAAIAGEPGMFDDVAAEAIAVIRATAPRRTLIHGDCQAMHVLLGPAGPTLVDLDLCGVGDPWYDIAVLATYTDQHRQALLAGYDPALPADADFLRVEHAYVTGRLLSAVIWRQDHHGDGDVWIEHLRAHARRGPHAPA